MSVYLITGGAGFIGSHLVDSLIADGHKVRVLDDLSTGTIDNLPKGIELIRADVTCSLAVRRALADVDGCFHLAAIASVERCRSEWLRSNHVNLGGTIAVFDEAVRAQAQRRLPLPVVYASSAAVYGAASRVPISEDVQARPANAYGVDKLACEMHAAVAAHVHGLRTIGLRLFNVYGPRQDPNSPYAGVISLFCRRMLEGVPLEIHGDGRQVRDFVFVEDAIAALRQAMQRACDESLVLNVCTGIGTSINQLGQAIAELCDSPFKPRYLAPRLADLRVSIGDPRQALDKLHFRAKTSLHEGLMRTMQPLMPLPIKRRIRDRLLLIGK